MKKIYALCILLLFATLIIAKPYTQQGIAYLYDYKTKTKSPVANVSLTVVGAQPTVSKADGTFTLVFNSFGLGDKISFEKQPYYQGMKVFNKKEVDNWFIVKDRLRLIMCRYEEFELAKNNFYQQGLRAATAKYEREITRIKDDQKLKEAEKNKKLQEAEERLQKVMESLSETSEAMARIDQSEVDVEMQIVLDLYEKGEVDEAMKRLSNMKLENSLEQSLKDKAAHQAGLQVAIEDSTRAVQNIRSAIELYKNNYEWEKVLKYQKVLADKLQTPHDLFQYAYYSFQSGGDPQEIELYFEKVLEATKESKQWNTYHLYLYATTMNNLACIYEAKEMYEKAEQAYKEGIEGRREYAHLTKNPNDENHIAWSLISLCQLYINHNQYQDAERVLQEAEDIYQKIKPTFYKDNEISYGRLYHVKGRLYHSTDQLNKAEENYIKAFELYGMDVYQNPPDHLTTMSRICFGCLCAIYDFQKRPFESEKYQKELVDLYLKWIPRYPHALKEGYAFVLNKLVAFYSEAQRFTEVEALYKQALEIYRQIGKDNPNAYEPDVAMTLGNLAILYSNTQRREEAEKTYKQVLEIFQRLAMDNPKTYEPYAAITLGGSSFNAFFLEKYPEAEQLARKGLELDSTQHWIASNLAAAILLQGRYAEAESIYRQYKDELKDGFLDDFEKFKAAGVIPKEREEDVEKIKRILEE